MTRNDKEVSPSLSQQFCGAGDISKRFTQYGCLMHNNDVLFPVRGESWRFMNSPRHVSRNPPSRHFQSASLPSVTQMKHKIKSLNGDLQFTNENLDELLSKNFHEMKNTDLEYRNKQLNDVLLMPTLDPEKTSLLKNVKLDPLSPSALQLSRQRFCSAQMAARRISESGQGASKINKNSPFSNSSKNNTLRLTSKTNSDSSSDSDSNPEDPLRPGTKLFSNSSYQRDIKGVSPRGKILAAEALLPSCNQEEANVSDDFCLALHVCGGVSLEAKRSDSEDSLLYVKDASNQLRKKVTSYRLKAFQDHLSTIDTEKAIAGWGDDWRAKNRSDELKLVLGLQNEIPLSLQLGKSDSNSDPSAGSDEELSSMNSYRDNDNDNDFGQAGEVWDEDDDRTEIEVPSNSQGKNLKKSSLPTFGKRSRAAFLADPVEEWRRMKESPNLFTPNMDEVAKTRLNSLNHSWKIFLFECFLRVNTHIQPNYHTEMSRAGWILFGNCTGRSLLPCVGLLSKLDKWVQGVTSHRSTEISNNLNNMTTSGIMLQPPQLEAFDSKSSLKKNAKEDNADDLNDNNNNNTEKTNVMVNNHPVNINNPDLLAATSPITSPPTEVDDTVDFTGFIAAFERFAKPSIGSQERVLSFAGFAAAVIDCLLDNPIINSSAPLYFLNPSLIPPPPLNISLRTTSSGNSQRSSLFVDGKTERRQITSPIVQPGKPINESQLHKLFNRLLNLVCRPLSPQNDNINTTNQVISHRTSIPGSQQPEESSPQALLARTAFDLDWSTHLPALPHRSIIHFSSFVPSYQYIPFGLPRSLLPFDQEDRELAAVRKAEEKIQSTLMEFEGHKRLEMQKAVQFLLKQRSSEKHHYHSKDVPQQSGSNYNKGAVIPLSLSPSVASPVGGLPFLLTPRGNERDSSVVMSLVGSQRPFGQRGMISTPSERCRVSVLLDMPHNATATSLSPRFPKFNPPPNNSNRTGVRAVAPPTSPLFSPKGKVKGVSLHNTGSDHKLPEAVVGLTFTNDAISSRAREMTLRFEKSILEQMDKGDTSASPFISSMLNDLIRVGRLKFRNLEDPEIARIEVLASVLHSFLETEGIAPDFSNGVLRKATTTDGEKVDEFRESPKVSRARRFSVMSYSSVDSDVNAEIVEGEQDSEIDTAIDSLLSKYSNEIILLGLTKLFSSRMSISEPANKGFPVSSEAESHSASFEVRKEIRLHEAEQLRLSEYEKRNPYWIHHRVSAEMNDPESISLIVANISLFNVLFNTFASETSVLVTNPPSLVGSKLLNVDNHLKPDILTSLQCNSATPPSTRAENQSRNALIQSFLGYTPQQFHAKMKLSPSATRNTAPSLNTFLSAMKNARLDNAVHVLKDLETNATSSAITGRQKNDSTIDVSNDRQRNTKNSPVKSPNNIKRSHLLAASNANYHQQSTSNLIKLREGLSSLPFFLIPSWVENPKVTATSNTAAASLKVSSPLQSTNNLNQSQLMSPLPSKLASLTLNSMDVQPSPLSSSDVSYLPVPPVSPIGLRPPTPPASIMSTPANLPAKSIFTMNFLPSSTPAVVISSRLKSDTTLIRSHAERIRKLLSNSSPKNLLSTGRRRPASPPKNDLEFSKSPGNESQKSFNSTLSASDLTLPPSPRRSVSPSHAYFSNTGTLMLNSTMHLDSLSSGIRVHETGVRFISFKDAWALLVSLNLFPSIVNRYQAAEIWSRCSLLVHKKDCAACEPFASCMRSSSPAATNQLGISASRITHEGMKSNNFSSPCSPSSCVEEIKLRIGLELIRRYSVEQTTPELIERAFGELLQSLQIDVSSHGQHVIQNGSLNTAQNNDAANNEKANLNASDFRPSSPSKRNNYNQSNKDKASMNTKHQGGGILNSQCGLKSPSQLGNALDVNSLVAADEYGLAEFLLRVVMTYLIGAGNVSQRTTTSRNKMLLTLSILISSANELISSGNELSSDAQKQQLPFKLEDLSHSSKSKINSTMIPPVTALPGSALRKFGTWTSLTTTHD